ncbi:hypothetical protein HPB49_009981 [Dermacentor silvarum]|uniref:Uncharacterized protein n=1 Tax=Dermacentor silvarum TaxID=543639 RepID=A0ACB8C2W3_DERSI|nr:hypothetical protein HPB49_009981 [Dermacentor silvarum]
MQRFWTTMASLERNRWLVWSLEALIVLMILIYLYVFIIWWEKHHPRPPLGILRGELLKDFDRYSPDDNDTEKVLEEVFGADVKPTMQCVTPGCKWLRKQTSDYWHSKPAPCADFYGHVCSGRGPLYHRASEDLMVAVVKHALGNSTRCHAREDSEASEHIRMLRHCVKGDRGASEFAFSCDFSKLGVNFSRPCPTDYPVIPHALSELVFKEDSDITAEESVRELGLSITLKHKETGTPKGITESRKEAICRWLADSARCHLSGKFRVTGDIVTNYQSLWNELYFAPLFEAKEESALWELHGGGKSARKRACAHIHEGLFRAQSIKMATAVLDKMMGDVQETIWKVLDTVQHMLSQRVPYWLSRHEEDELLRYQVRRRPAYMAELQAVDVELAGLSEPSASDLGTSVFSWKEGNDQHLAYVTECFRSVHNATLDVDGNATLLKELIYESALLGPLFDVYRKAIFETFDAEVYLHDRYDNWQLFFVFWAMTHCGDPQQADLVNAVLRNSKRTPPPPKASTGISAPASRMQQISMALARLERNRPLVWSLLSLMVVLALTNIYLFIHWWEKRHPKPPLGILRGELLKDFERYSPDDNHTEKVLEEVLGPDVEPTVQCVTPGCKWLNQQTSGNGHWRPAPCADFYGHVCNGRRALYYRASKKLMVAVVKHALSYSKRRHAREDSEASEHVRMLRHCVKGDLGASDFAFGW